MGTKRTLELIPKYWGVNQADMFAKGAAPDPELPLPPTADTISKLEFNSSVLLAGCGWDGEVRAMTSLWPSPAIHIEFAFNRCRFEFGTRKKRY